MGATFRVPLAGWDDVTGSKVALTADAPTAIWDAELPDRATFLLGAEREGLPADLDADLRVAVPLSGDAESLNVAMAGTVALYEWRRRHAD
jgi:tRNA G18 (ribose-2'-O)-methylase SpoU